MNPCPRRLANIPVILAILASSPASGQEVEGSSDRLIGFAPAARAAELRAERKALAVPTPEHARAWLRTLTEEPHVAGTPADRKTAEFVRDKLRSWGWATDLVEYEVLLNYPQGSPTLELILPEKIKLAVTEEANRRDKDSASPDAWPAFHGYSVSGDVTGQVVYANYGRPDDFESLERLGVEVEGKIVLVRYGGIFRGLKVLNAQRRGAIGVLIYSDPADDGYMKGDVYPVGPYRPGSALQRGSVQFLSLGPGDPSTPNGPSTKDADRIPIDPLNGVPTPGLPGQGELGGESVVQNAAVADKIREWERATGLKRSDYYATIPSLPISYDAARPILDALGGPNVPGEWQGGLPFAYHVGPGPAEVHFATLQDYKIRPIWNVIATLEGSGEPDRWVMIGNHRDAWTYGAVDPSSGTAATMEVCRALGEAAKDGWKPRRTLVYASWDAEEYGLVGSTEWAEEHADELTEKAIFMMNVDVAVGGPTLSPGGVPSLRDLFLSAAADVTDPRNGKTLAESWLKSERAAWAKQVEVTAEVWSGDAEDAPLPDFHPQLSPLGSGSDYTAFVDHLGIPALDLSFGGHYGVYHSIYDDFFWMEQFGDPEFLTHTTAARLYTLIAMRAASAEVVPLTFTPYARAIKDHVDDLRRIVARKERASGERYELKGLPEIVAAVKRFEEQAHATDRAAAELARAEDVGADRLSRVNDALTAVERAFLLPDGLPGRPWFKHAIYAPGLTTGYASWPLPGVRQALLEDDAEMLQTQAEALVERLDAATDALRRAAELAGKD